jgi:Protein of unknown function (DUF2630)
MIARRARRAGRRPRRRRHRGPKGPAALPLEAAVGQPGLMDDDAIHARITALVEQEHVLRRRVAGGEITSAAEQAQLRELEEALDTCWDLLRQRQARRGAGADPDVARARPTAEVEEYLQ